MKEPARRAFFLVALVLPMVLHDRPVRADAPTGRYSALDCEGTPCVKDAKTALTWKKSEETGTFTWAAAKAQCTGTWRLPSIRELHTLVDPTRAAAPMIDTTYFTSAGEFTWSGSPRGTGGAWAVWFDTGGASSWPASTSYRVRCVR